ncbi:helix-turn-helix domain-containing protein [Kitasatospora sp. NPDC056731]|uniref:helix-turn-helix domain-containing protein n=1 Tax=Kitasatospora sp. NPDC056731 TaxID=3155422 RepID=UPI00342FEE41
MTAANRAHGTHVESPVLTLAEAAVYVRRTPKAMYGLRDRRSGPSSFRLAGRVYYRRTALDAWLAEGEAGDSRSNLKLDPTRKSPELRRSRST